MRTAITLVLLFVFSPLYGQQWKSVSPLPVQHVDFGFCELEGGTILISGGYVAAPTGNTSTHMYDPGTTEWTTVPGLNIGRSRAPMVRLLDGRVLYPSGIATNSSMTKTCEVYTPSTGMWTLTEGLKQPRAAESAITLPDGKVLIVGGLDWETQTTHATCELYDPGRDTVTFTGEINQWQAGMTLFLDTPRNKVVMISGYFPALGVNTFLSQTEEYDILTGTWAVVAQSKKSHFMWPQQSIQLPNGDILAPSGLSDSAKATSLIEIYTPSTQTWRTLGELPVPCWLATTVYLGNDLALIAGGYNTVLGPIRHCWLINVKTGEVTAAPSLLEARYQHRAHVRSYIDRNDPQKEVTEVTIFGGIGSGSTAALTSCEQIEFRRPISFVHPGISASTTLHTSFDPVREKLICTDSIGTDRTVELVNVLGQVILTSTLSATEHRVEFSTTDLPNGLYFLKAMAGMSARSTSIVLSR